MRYGNIDICKSHRINRTGCLVFGRTGCLVFGRTGCLVFGRTGCLVFSRTGCLVFGRTVCLVFGRIGSLVFGRSGLCVNILGQTETLPKHFISEPALIELIYCCSLVFVDHFYLIDFFH